VSRVEPGRPALRIGGQDVAPGSSRRVEIPLARLPATQLQISMPVDILHGARPGPALWLSGVVHGDELNGVEIIRQVRRRLSPAELRGTILTIPIVNMFAFTDQSRYLPDRRDLNRSFPGSPRGSLAARLAHIFMEQIVERCEYGIDFHTGSDHRRNLPQIRGDLRNPETARLAAAFGAPVSIDARTRDGSLRDAASRRGKHVLLFEGGEAQRFNRDAVRVGVAGTFRVLAALGMIEASLVPADDRNGGRPAPASPVATKTQWVRARASGLLRMKVALGDRVERNEVVGVISDAFGEMDALVKAPHAGLVIARTHNPLVRRGDALVHLAIEFASEAATADAIGDEAGA
jgi:predicted deacylase